MKPDHTLEYAVLGAMLLDNQRGVEVMAKVELSDLTYKQSRVLYAAALDLHERGQPFDSASIIAELTKAGKLSDAGGAEHICWLTEMAVSLPALNAHVRMLREDARRLRLGKMGNWIAAQAARADIDVAAIQDQIAEAITKMNQGCVGDGTAASRDFAREYLNGYDGRQGDKPVVTGIAGLDKMIGGIYPKHLVVIGARPSMGKSALAWQVFEQAAFQGHEPLLFSVEMSDEDIGDRKTAELCGTDLHRVITGKLSDVEMGKVVDGWKSFAEYKWHINTTAPMNISRIRTISKRWAQAGVGMILVDYLQLLSGSPNARSREQEVTSISSGLKALAKELNLPVVAVCQVNRACEQRNDKRPLKSDLRESGSLEQDADEILLIHREGYYDTATDASRAEINVAKHRNGATGVVHCTFDVKDLRFK